MKALIYESTQRFFEKSLHLKLNLERIPAQGPTVKRGFENHYVPAVGLTFHLDMDEILDRSYAQNEVDEDCFAFLRTHVTQPSTAVDIGANQGMYTCMLLHEFPALQVVAIEPDPYSTAKLRRNVELNNLDETRLSLFEVAASGVSEQRELMINVSGNRGGSSLVVDQRQWTGLDDNVTIAVQCRTLLDMLTEAGASSVSVMKIDIEGFEFPVLEAFLRDAPESLYPRAIVVEAYGHCIPLVGGSTLELLIRHGYHLVDHLNANYFLVWPENATQ
jgi:FkbM family methyltransferase